MKRYALTALTALTALLACGLYGASTANASEIYFVDNAGAIRSFTGIGDGANPLDGNTFGAGNLQNTVVAYGSYQGFTSTPDGMVYGVNGSGGVDSWSSIASWISGDAATSLSTGVYGVGSNVNGGVQGLSYDGNTGGFYAIMGGTTPNNASNPDRDGRLRQFATLSDFINNVNGTDDTSAGFGGNILNFYYMDEDAPARSSSNPVAEAGSNYFQVAGNGSLEGWTLLEGEGFGYFGAAADPVGTGGTGAGGNRSYQNTVTFGNTVIGGFSVVIPEPTSLALMGIGGLCMLSRRRR